MEIGVRISVDGVESTGYVVQIIEAEPEVTRSPSDIDAIRPETFDVLTPRQREVLYYVAAGLKNQQIADRLSIAERTVRVHVMDIMAGLNVGSSRQLGALALMAGVVTPDQIKAIWRGEKIQFESSEEDADG